MSITKAELIDELAGAADVTKSQAENLLNALVKKVTDTVKTPGAELQIAGLGKFSSTIKAARTGRNPSTGEAMQIPAKAAPKFSMAKQLKDAAATQATGKKGKK